jgi:hypothetical protein
VSDQDLFFDEEPSDKKPTLPAPKATSKAGAQKAVTPKSGAAPAAKSAPSKAAPAAPVVASGGSDSSTMMAVAVLIGVVGLLLGAILGFLLGSAVAKSASAPKSSGAQSQTLDTGSGSTGVAAPLSSGATLPPGHPAINAPAASAPATN